MTFATSKTIRSFVLAGCATSALILSGAASAQAAEQHDFEIAPQDLGDALAEFSVQGDAEVYWLKEDVAGKKTDGVSGSYTNRQAIEKLLNDAGVEYRIDDNGTLLVGEAYIQRASLGEGSRDARSFRMASLAQENDSVVEVGTPRDEGDDGSDEHQRDTIVVTGTNIRGIAPESSPTRTFDREDIQVSGAATAQEFIRTLPQNFGGGSNPNTGVPSEPSSGGNGSSFGSFGSSVNLRGLGSGSTLILLNGRRIAPASFNADFTDISMIPASAIERVETLTDGASSIYGSDAVAGVVNFILRDDFDGLETSFRYGTGTERGTPDQYRANVTGGKDWGAGHGLIVYEFFNQEQLSVEDRDFAAKDFVPSYLLPSQKRHSVLASAAQEISSNFEIFGDLTYSNRKARQLRTIPLTGFTSQFDASSTNLNVSVGGDWRITSDWFFDFSGTYSEVDTNNETSLDIEEFRSLDSKMWTADAKLSGGLFNLPGGDVKLAFGGQFRAESFSARAGDDPSLLDTIEREAKRDVYAAFAEIFIPIVGQENQFPGVERFEVNASGRFEDYSDFGSTTNPKVGLLWSPIENLNFRGTYSTSFKAPPLGNVGDNGFGASALNTSFINGIFGLTAPDPSLDDVVELIVFGTSRNLGPETSRAFTAGLDFQQKWAAHNIAFSTTWFDIDYEGRLGNTPCPGCSFFPFDALNIAFNDPNEFPEGTIIFAPTMEEIAAIIDNVDFVASPFGDDPLSAAVINNARVIRNLSRTVASGLDFGASYSLDLNQGKFLLGLDGTYLHKFEQQAAVTTPLVGRLNTLFNPVDFKLRGRAGFSNDNLSANIFLNFVDSYRVDNTPNADKIDSWTTVDVSLAYDTKNKFGNSLLNDTVYRISVTNLLGEDPPIAPVSSSIAVDGFDPTNASPLGRFISFELTKRW